MTSTSQSEPTAHKGPFPGPIGFEHDPILGGASLEFEDVTTAQAIAILALYLGAFACGVVAFRRIGRQLRGRQA